MEIISVSLKKKIWLKLITGGEWEGTLLDETQETLTMDNVHFLCEGVPIEQREVNGLAKIAVMKHFIIALGPVKSKGESK